MEKAGLNKSLELLKANNIKIDCIVTDRHLQIQAFLREKKIKQFYDVWHVEKSRFSLRNILYEKK